MNFSKEEVLLLETEVVDLINGWIFNIEYARANYRYIAVRRFCNLMLITMCILVFAIGEMSPFMWQVTRGAVIFLLTMALWSLIASSYRKFVLRISQNPRHSYRYRRRAFTSRPEELTNEERNSLLALRHVLLKDPITEEVSREVHDELSRVIQQPNLKEWLFLVDSLKRVKVLFELPSRHQV